MEAINQARQRVWQQQPTGFLSRAVIDIDGTIAPTLGECKAGMDISYKRIWGYAPLIVSLSNTKEVLYLVNRDDLVWHEVVQDANERCNQENVVAQLKSGVNAMRVPVNDLNSNRAFMFMAMLAWNLKASFGLMVPRQESELALVKMEFRSFLAAVLMIPAQIIRTGRKNVYRLLRYNPWVRELFATWERLRRMETTMTG